MSGNGTIYKPTLRLEIFLMENASVDPRPRLRPGHLWDTSSLVLCITVWRLRKATARGQHGHFSPGMAPELHSCRGLRYWGSWRLLAASQCPQIADISTYTGSQSSMYTNASSLSLACVLPGRDVNNKKLKSIAILITLITLIKHIMNNMYFKSLIQTCLWRGGWSICSFFNITQ